MDITPSLFIGIVVLSLVLEYTDASIGGGYGTALTPILLMMGFVPLEAVPCVLFGQLVGGISGGFFHHKLGNVRLDFRRDEAYKKKLGILGYMPKSTDSKVILVISLCGLIGALGAVFFALNIPSTILSAYIGVMVLAIGIIVLVQRNKQIKLSWKGLVGVGLVSAFNKGASGGGYGPLVTSGQVVSGREARSSVASTTMTEVVVCTVGFIAYLVLSGDIYWKLAAATSIGAVVAGPFAAITVKKVDSKKLRVAIGVITVALGCLTLSKLIVKW